MLRDSEIVRSLVREIPHADNDFTLPDLRLLKHLTDT
jgi:hypothetical protein